MFACAAAASRIRRCTAFPPQRSPGAGVFGLRPVPADTPAVGIKMRGWQLQRLERCDEIGSYLFCDIQARREQLFGPTGARPTVAHTTGTHRTSATNPDRSPPDVARKEGPPEEEAPSR